MPANGVRCRAGSSEIKDEVLTDLLPVRCRAGSSETCRHKLGHVFHVRCRAGSSEMLISGVED